MTPFYGRTQPLWARDQDVPQFERLTEGLEVDVCVVGAGIAGLTTAYLLAREGRKVVLLESRGVAGGESARTTAHLSSALDDRFYHLEDLFGEDGARDAYLSHSQAIDCIEQICKRENIDCQFTRLDGYLFVPRGESQDELDREYDATQRLGIPAERLERAPLNTFATGPCLKFPHQAQFNPALYLSGLARRLSAMGVPIYTGALVDNVTGGDRPFAEISNGTKVHANAVVLATNTPIHDNLTIHARQAPYRTYAIAASIAWNLIPRALYWDTLDPYHYVRLKSAHTPTSREGSDTLIVGGADHRQASGDDERGQFESLEQWTRERFPILDIEYRWSGMVLEPSDSLALIGRDNAERNVFIATGDSGHGMTHGTIAGMLLTDLIQGRQNSWERIYDPRRVTARAALDYLSDNAEVVASLAEWATGGDVANTQQIAPGSGAVIRHGLEKRAVYRDEEGTCVELSAVCPHLGCIVHWNSAEGSWDCPCHGSRFDAHGKVLRGPATSDLQPAP